MVDTPHVRKRVAWEQVESEQNIFIDILSRLPVESIRSFKAINKYWYASIGTMVLANKQLTRSRENPEFITCQIEDIAMELYSMKLGSLDLSYVSEINPPEKINEEIMQLVSSFNGLICITNQIYYEAEPELSDLQIWVCNPCTGENLLLPQGSLSLYQSVPRVGVAYYSDTSDYTVFRIYCSGKRSHNEEIRFIHEFEVYSSTTGSWEWSGHVPCVPTAVPLISGHVFVGGKIYWLCSENSLPCKILSVDLSGEFKVFNLPRYPQNFRDDEKITEGTHLISLRGALVVVVIHTEYMYIWKRKEGGKKSGTWVSEYVDIPVDDLEIVLSMTSSEKKIIFLTDQHWHSFDVVTREWISKEEYSGDFYNPSVFPFTESVLPCNGGMMLKKER